MCMPVTFLQVFFAGCLGVCAANLLLLFVLGSHDEQVRGLRRGVRDRVWQRWQW